MKKQDVMSWLILIAIFAFGGLSQMSLQNLRDDIRNSRMPKLTISDNQQFDQLCKQFSEQWQAKDYAVYLLQPNAAVKTHKELAAASINGLPIMLEIVKYDDVFNKNLTYYYGDSKMFEEATGGMIDINSNFAMVPIYRHNVIIAEMYLLYDDIPEKFDNRVAEAQMLSQLIK